MSDAPQTRPLTKDEGDRLIGDRMTWLEIIVLLFFVGTITKIFTRVVMRAYERGFLTSTAMHELCGVWERMVQGK